MVRRRWWLIASAVASAAAAGAVVMFATVLPPHQSADVAVPPDSARPDRVVMAYLSALDAHDCRTAEALMMTGAEQVARSWCADVASIENVHMDSASSLNENATVSVSFVLEWRPFRNDGSLSEGPTTQDYDLTRVARGGPWRIVDQGEG